MELICFAARTEVKMPGRRRPILFLFLFLLLFGSFALFNSLNNPRMAALHGSDFVQLIASGICFGFALAILLGWRKFRGA
jgi:hypothetical protein